MATAQSPERRRIKDLEVMIAEVVVETPDTVTLVLFTGNDRLDYKPGHFLTIDPHQFEALETCDVLEASTPLLDDVVRLQDRYGRA